MTTVESGGYWTVISKLLFTLFATMLSLAVVPAQTWYLMAPAEKIVIDPKVAVRMEHGPVLGPLEFLPRGRFASRAECEPARLQLINQWRQLSVIKRAVRSG